jgi:DNA-binding NarL/FixJ family response regulator
MALASGVQGRSTSVPRRTTLTGMEPIRVALFDDHTLFRQGTRGLLERDGQVTVVAEAGDGREALELLETVRPDVVVVDIEMPEVGGIEVTRRVKERDPSIGVLVLSVHDEAPIALAILEAGADGYLLKDVESRELLDAVQRVHAGESVLHPAVARHVLSRVRSGGQQPDAGRALTGDERRVLLLAARGLTNREIAEQLQVSPRTIQQRLTHAFERLGVGSRTEAAIRALQEGVFTLEDL